MWTCFFISHILLMILYMIVNYKEIERKYKMVDAEEFINICLEVPTYFYLVPILFLAVSLNALEKTSEGFIPVVSILVLTLIAMMYNYIVNISIKKRENSAKFVENDFVRLFNKKNANIPIFLIIESIAAGMFYSSVLVELSEKRVALIFVIELYANLLAYGIYHHYLKRIGRNIIEGIAMEYPRWQLLVPKKIGVGYSLNFNCPFTYLLLFAATIAIIIYLLCP